MHKHRLEDSRWDIAKMEFAAKRKKLFQTKTLAFNIHITTLSLNDLQYPWLLFHYLFCTILVAAPGIGFWLCDFVHKVLGSKKIDRTIWYGLRLNLFTKRITNPLNPNIYEYVTNFIINRHNTSQVLKSRRFVQSLVKTFLISPLNMNIDFNVLFYASSGFRIKLTYKSFHIINNY